MKTWAEPESLTLAPYLTGFKISGSRRDFGGHLGQVGYMIGRDTSPYWDQLPLSSSPWNAQQEELLMGFQNPQKHICMQMVPIFICWQLM